MDRTERQRRVDTIDYWYHSIDVGEGIVTPGQGGGTPWMLDRIGLPEDLTGKRALELAPWDHVLRNQYLNQKIGFEWPVVTGSDTAESAAALARLDAQVRNAIMDFPEELTLYTLLADLHANAKDAPGYDRVKHQAAVDLAVKRFPNDPEVQRRSQELVISE